MALRNEILRQPLGLSLSRAELEGESDSFHVVALHNNRVVGCVVLKPLGEARVRMRQLCVDPLYRGCGIGKALVQSAERLAAESGFTEVVLHARKQVVSFYEKLGYTPEGEFFVEVGIPHRRMRKKIVSVQPEGNPP
ncbi:MAG: GNAT family N-acetyltransferase [Kiritimatiellae bacterium]|nr:GNAT family N-acetyltransferase [Kiritimatiellia bacterium]